jgi:hypothetical protein
MKNLFRLVRFVWNHPMNRSARLAALGRVIRWQLASRLVLGPIALPFINGTYLFATRGMTGATGNWYCGLHEYEDMPFVLHNLKSGDLFVDVGANIGSYSILAAGGVPSVCILGGGHYGRFMPYPNHVDGVKPISVIHKMDCFGCNWQCKLTKEQDQAYPCVRDISVKQVLKAVKIALMTAQNQKKTKIVPIETRVEI